MVTAVRRRPLGITSYGRPVPPLGSMATKAEQEERMDSHQPENGFRRPSALGCGGATAGDCPRTDTATSATAGTVADRRPAALLTDEEYRRLTAARIAVAVGDGSLSAADVTEAALRRIRQVDGAVRAFREVWADRAREEALRVDVAVRHGARLALAGVPVALKGPEGAGSLQSQRLLAAGCVPLGTTSTPGRGTRWQTWGSTDRGPTLNPWRPDLTPGGSSAGAAVAVATSMVPLATGSDGAGSVRIPAAWCGVFGLKPTNGRVPARDRAGLNVGGALARNAEDLALYLDAVAGARSTEPGGGGGSFRVAWSADLGYADTDPEIAETARAALTRLIGDGQLVEVPYPIELQDPAPTWTALRDGGPSSFREVNDRELERIFRAVDLIATPTTPNPPHGHAGPGPVLSVALTWAFNLSGHPAVSVPAGRTSDGAPVGLQVVAPRHAEASLLAVCRAVGPVSCP
jgi:amidase